MTEEAILKGCLNNDATAQRELYNRYSPKMLAVCYRFAHNREDAEDNLQNVLVKAFHHIDRFEGNSQFSTWLVRITINEALMKLRKRNSERISDYQAMGPNDDEPRAFPEIEDTRQDLERQYMSKELAHKAFYGLNPSLQDTFILQKAEGWTNRELAQALGITVSTVKSRIFRARVRLRQQLRTLSDTSQQPIALQS